MKDDVLRLEKLSCLEVIEKAYQKGKDDATEEFIKFAYALGIDFSSMKRVQNGTYDMMAKMEQIKEKFCEDQNKLNGSRL